VPETIASALHVSGAPPADRIRSSLAQKSVLLILDNCEHVVNACADFCSGTLEACPDLTIVATSREALGVPGESRWPLAPMNESDASDLFDQRARLVQPAFELSSSNRNIVAEICRRLDDLPLAIELAASRVGMMTELQIYTELADRFHVLSSSRSRDPRHQTMTAAIDWSYRLLTESEAALFRRASVFRGGFSLESARAVCGDDVVPDVLAALGGLVEKSMVVVERQDDGNTRHRLLESQAVYAEAKLRGANELQELQRRHYEHFAVTIPTKVGGLTGDMAEVETGVPEANWVGRERPNLWAAIRWARDNRDDLGLLLAAHVALGPTADLRRTRTWLVELLEQSPEQGPARLTALSTASYLAYLQGEFQTAADFAKQGLDFVRPDPSRAWKDAEALMLWHLGNGLDGLGDLKGARLAYDKALSLLEGSTNVRLEPQLKHAFGDMALAEGRCEEAVALLTECLPDFEAHNGPTALAGLLDSLAMAELACGDRDSAERHWKQSLSTGRAMGHQVLEVWCLSGLSQVATATEEHDRAIRLAAAHRRLSEEMSISDPPYWRDKMELSIRVSRAALGSKNSDEAWRQGLAMELDRAVDYGLEGRLEVSIDPGPLSRREIQVVRVLAAGMTNREIAARLFLSERTVEGHLERIRNKLGVRSRIEVATWAVEHGLVEEEKGTRAGSP
jgi:predicted ATPase/DNA-binding NarL/FixJ family response regulator